MSCAAPRQQLLQQAMNLALPCPHAASQGLARLWPQWVLKTDTRCIETLSETTNQHANPSKDKFSWLWIYGDHGQYAG